MHTPLGEYAYRLLFGARLQPDGVPDSRLQVGGGVDAKVVAVSDMRESGLAVRVHAASGPTHDQQAVFTWNHPAYATISHIGLPESYDFDYVEMTGLGMPSAE